MNITIKNFVDYLKYENTYSGKTIESYFRDILKFETYINQEGILLEKVTPADLRNFITIELENGVTKRSCKRRLSALNLFFNYIEEKEADNFPSFSNPCDVYTSPKMDKRYPNVLYKEDIEKILDATKEKNDVLGIRDQAIISMLYYSGIRVSELVGLDVQSVNLKTRRAVVFGKGSRERIVLISESCKEIIQKYLKDSRPNLIKQNNLTPSLFLNNFGKRITTRGVEYILKKFEERSGLYLDLHPHIFRHSFATHILDAGADLREIQEMLGHKSINSTQIYTHISESSMKQTYTDNFPRAKKK